MAEKKTNPENERPFAELSEEAIKHLDAIGRELETAEGDIDALEEIGLDMSRLRERIAWGKKAREVILSRFGSGGKK